MEIDISIPSLKLAIEINGPVHYFPVFGESKFEDIKQKDNQKFRELNDMGYSFLVINVSMITSRKKQTEFINQIFQETVKPLIESKMVPL